MNPQTPTPPQLTPTLQKTSPKPSDALSSKQKTNLLLILIFSALIIPITVWAALNRSTDTRSRGYTATPISPPYVDPFNPDIDQDGDVDFLDYDFYAHLWNHNLFDLAKISQSFTSYITPTPSQYDPGKYFDTYMYSANGIMPNAVGSIITEVQSRPQNQYYREVYVKGQVYNLRPDSYYQLVFCNLYSCYSSRSLHSYSDYNGTSYYYGYFKYYEGDPLQSVYLIQADNVIELESLNKAANDNDLVKLEGLSFDPSAITPFPTPKLTIYPTPTPTIKKLPTPTNAPSIYPTPTPAITRYPTPIPIPSFPPPHYGECYSLNYPCAQGWIYNEEIMPDPYPTEEDYIPEPYPTNEDVLVEPNVMKTRHD